MGVVNGVLELPAKSRTAGVGMSRLDEVIGEAKKECAITGAHQSLGSFWEGFVLVKIEAAVLIALLAFAGTERKMALLGDFFEVFLHGRVLGSRRVIAI